jgi:hypothetical protein
VSDSDPKRAKREQGGKPSGSWAVSPTELREALSGLGKAAVRFELSEMHDASEVGHALTLFVSMSCVYCHSLKSPHFQETVLSNEGQERKLVHKMTCCFCHKRFLQS